jgi:Fe-S cluster biogenesis protein NfuA
MKEKYITLQVVQACLSKHAGTKKDIHEQLKETVAERKKIMKQFENILQAA